MSKVKLNLTIDHDVSDLARSKYPGQLSSMIENFLRGVVNAEIPDFTDLSEQDIKDARQMKAEMIAKLKSELSTLDAQEVLNKKRMEEEDKEILQKALLIRKTASQLERRSWT